MFMFDEWTKVGRRCEPGGDSGLVLAQVYASIARAARQGEGDFRRMFRSRLAHIDRVRREPVASTERRRGAILYRGDTVPTRRLIIR